MSTLPAEELASAAEDKIQQPPPTPLVSAYSLPLIGIFVLLLFYTFYLAASILMPIMLAFLLSILLAPPVRWLDKLDVPTPLGAALVLITLLGILVSAVYLLSEPAAEWLKLAPAAFDELEYKLRIIKEPLAEMQAATEQVERQAGFGIAQDHRIVEVRDSSLARVVLTGTPKVLADIGIIFILMYFLLATGDSFLRKLVNVIPRLSDKKRAVEIVRSIQSDMSSYLLTITVINFCLGAVCTAAFYIIGLPNALLWGLMVALFNFAPYIGVLMSFSVLLIVSFLTFDSFAQTFVAPLVFLGLTTLEGQLITPMVVGHRLELSPVVIFLWIVIWGWMWGVVGALIAIPLIACLKIICEGIPPLQPVAVLMSR